MYTNMFIQCKSNIGYFFFFVIYCQEAVRTVQPILLFHLVSYFVPGSNVTKLEAYLYAVGVTLTSLLSVMLHQVYFFNGHRTGMKLRIAAVGCIYRKASTLHYCFYTEGCIAGLCRT